MERRGGARIYRNASYILNLKQIGNIRNRLQASAKSNGHVFMMTKVNDRSTLAGINKDTGETRATIPLARRDDNPMYQVDASSGLLFYAPKGKNLLAGAIRQMQSHAL
jgi:hypothetical protein